MSVGNVGRSVAAFARAMNVGFAYAITNAIFGGSAEYVALLFMDRGIESNFYR